MPADVEGVYEEIKGKYLGFDAGNWAGGRFTETGSGIERQTWLNQGAAAPDEVCQVWRLWNGLVFHSKARRIHGNLCFGSTQGQASLPWQSMIRMLGHEGGTERGNSQKEL